VRFIRVRHLTVAVILPVLLFAAFFALSPVTTAQAQEGATLSIDKSILGNPASVQSGEPFKYVFAYRCASIDTNCENATITDALPAGMEFLGVELPPGTNTTATYNESTNTVVISFGTPLNGGKVGLAAGYSGFIVLNARFAPGILPGTTLTNTVAFSATNATAIGDNAPPVDPTGQFEMFARKRIISDPIVQGEPIEFALELCSPDDVGGIPFIGAVMTDTLPFGATFVSAQGVQNSDWTYNPATRELAFLTLEDPVPVGGCVTRTMRLSYPVGSTGNLGENNTLEITGTPEGCDVLPLPAWCEGQGERTLTDSETFDVGVPFASLKVTKSSDAASSFYGTEALLGEAVTYTVGAENDGFLSLTNVAITDTIPAEFVLGSLRVGSYNGQPVALSYRTSPAGAWTAATGSPFLMAATTKTVAELGIPANAQALQWELGDMAHPSAPAWQTQLFGTVKESTALDTVFTNSVDGSATGPLPTSETVTDTASANVKVIDARAIPRAKKESSVTGQVLPGEIITFTVRILNESVAHLPITNPVMGDLLPAQFEYVTNSLTVISKPAGAPTGTLLVQDDYNATGRTLLRATFAGAPNYNLMPGEEIVLRYVIKVVDGTAPSIVQNEAIIGGVEFPPVPACPVGEQVTDMQDLDGDGLSDDVICQNPGDTGQVRVGVLLALESQKLVKGIFDAEFSKFGRTAPGSTADYRMEITNTSNVSISNLVVVDILPYIGDKGVIDNTGRQSKWQPNLVGEVTAPALPLTVYYSKSTNPCRPELVPGGPAGCDPSWSTTLPLNALSGEPDPTLVRAVKLDFCTYDGGGNVTECVQLERNETLSVTWPMRAPVEAPVSDTCMLATPGVDCQIAWNSFGVTAQGAGLDFLPTEPIKVGIGAANNPETYGVGDFVWLDVAGAQNDGIQQPGEQGINGIRVELWNATTNTLVDSTLTANDQNQLPGYYLFENRPAGNYFLRFFKPTAFTASPANAGADDARDSDGKTPGNDATYGDYYQTDAFLLGPTTPERVDRTRDFGLVRITEYGDAPYGKLTSWAAAANDADSFLAARHIIVSETNPYRLGALRDVEDDGQPNPAANGDDLNPSSSDDEDGVTLPGLLPDVAGTGDYGVFMRGVQSTLSIAVTAPSTGTAYVNAWIDWNADGDWNDSGEQVALNRNKGSNGSGTITLNVTPPTDATLGTTYARFRLSPEQGLLPTGMAIDGEVEDYRIQIIERPAKSIAATSEVHTAATNPVNLVPGEIISYTLRAAIPEGNVRNVIFRDNLPAGLQYLGGVVIGVESDTTMNIAIPTPTPSGGPFGDGTDPIFTFGNVLNNDSDEGNEYITLRFNALVLNSTANKVPPTRNFDNNFTFSYDGFTNTTPNVRATLVEPKLTIAKTIKTAPVDAGDPIVYQVVVSNATGGTNTTAFDTVISDTLNSNLALSQVTVSAAPPASTNNSNIGANLVNVTVPRIDPGQSITLLITATVKNDVPTSIAIPNLARVTWTSLPGDNGTATNPTGGATPGAPGTATGERTGEGGAINTYTAQSSRPASLAGTPAITKSVGKTQFTIGEEVIYTLTVTLPEGVTKNVVVTDTLPAGLGFTSAAILSTGFTGTPLPTAAPTQAGQVLTWTFGDTSVAGTPQPGASTFRIRVNAVVQNVMGNQRLVTLTNKASLIYNNPAGGTLIQKAPDVNINLVEPVLQVSKSVVTAPNADAGDFVTYTVDLRHNSATSVGTAYGVVLTDTLPAELENFQIVEVIGTNMVAPVAAINGTTLRWPATGAVDVANNGRVAIIIKATIKDSVRPGATVTNRANTTWSSLGGTPPQERVSGDGLLDGGGLNDYEVQTQRNFTVANQAAVAKALVNSSAAHTAGANVTIGEVITYRIPITLAEGTIASLTITDNVPSGMAYVGSSLKVNAGSVALPTPTVAPAANGTPGQDVVVTFGPIVVPGDNDPANNSFALELQLLVLDLPANVGVGTQTVLPNSVTWRTGTDAPKSTNVVNVTVVEPQMSIRKEITPATAAANDVVTVTLVISNIGTSTAFSATFTDTLPTGLLYVDGLTTVSGPTPTSLTQSSGTISGMWEEFTVGPVATIRFRAKLAADVELAEIITNVALVDDATTLPGDDPNERTEPKVEDPADVRVIVPDLRILKDDGVTEVVGGQLLIYTLAITNTGERAADGVIITDTVPANTTFVADGSAAGWMRAPGSGTGACETGDPAGTVCTFAVGTMASGATLDVDFAVRVDGDIPFTVETIDNTATVDNDGSHGDDPTPKNNTDGDIDNHVSAGLGDFVWLDTNGNGIQESGEVGVEGVTVRLLTSTGAFITETTTSASGYYSFTNLVPAGYIVEFIPPADRAITLGNVGDDTADSDANRVTGQSPAVTLAALEFNPTIDAGLYVPAELGDYVWLDTNVNGLQDNGETPISAVTVKLFRTGETTAISETTTNATGYYSFTNLIPGTYFIEVTPPAGHRITPVQNSAEASADTNDSDVSPSTGRSGDIVLISGQNDPRWDAGLFQPARLGDYVWDDLNYNGVQDEGEPFIDGVTVNLYKAGTLTTPISTTTTAGGGKYLFDNLIPADYVVEFVKGPQYKGTQQNIGDDTLDSDADPVSGFTEIITLANHESNLTVDAGFYIPAKLGDYVWEDKNGNGIQDDGEPAIGNVRVNLLKVIDSVPTQIATQLTNSFTGEYLFDNLLPGTYIVQFVKPAAGVFTLQDQGNDNAVDSDANPEVGTTQGRTAEITLKSGDDDRTWDAGIYVPAELGNRVWHDVNVNGIQDSGEANIPGAKVELFRTSTNESLGFKTTNGSGLYYFIDLAPGDYYIVVTPPDGYRITPVQNGPTTNASDSDVSPITGVSDNINLESGQSDPSWDAGLYRPAKLGNFVWEDLNHNGVQDPGEPGISGVTVNLYKADGTTLVSTTTTTDGGAYLFDNLIPGGYIVEFVADPKYTPTQLDQGDDTTDSDLIPATGRTAVVTLEDNETDLSVDAGYYIPVNLGDYVWNDLNRDGRQDEDEPGVPDMLVELYLGSTRVLTTTTGPDGSYLFANLAPGVYEVKFIATGEQVFTLANVPSDDAVDSDANPATGGTGSITLVSGLDQLVWDAGIYIPAKLGDLVWEDTNGNGVQDGGELGVDGVTVNLYTPADTVNPIATMQTAGGGLYLFENLVPGDYFVEFVTSGSQKLTRQDLGGNDAADSDASTATTTYGRTIATNLISGEDDRTWDAGIYIPAAVGDRVWLDVNGNGIQDGDEAGVPGVVVRLANLDLSTVITQATGADGIYNFTDLPPGNYRIEVIPPADHRFTQPNAGGDINVNSKVDPTTGRIADFLLESGETNLTKDAGIYRPAITIKKYTNGEDANSEPGPTISEGSPVTWTYYITNSGSVLLEQLTLADDVVGAVTCPVSSLAPGASTLCTAKGVATLGQYTNLGTVTAAPPSSEIYTSPTVSANDPSHYLGVDRVITVQSLVECRADGAFVDVVVSGLNFDPQSSTPLTLTWQTVTGTVVYAIPNLPLTVNNVIWPGTVVDGATGPVLGGSAGAVPPGTTISGWPGWAQDINLDWYEIPTDLRPQLKLVASVNPLQEETLVYPDATPHCWAGPRSSLGDFVWNDTNANGIQDQEELGINGVTVNLYRVGTDEPIATTTTANGGYYLFPNLTPDSYVVEFVAPQGAVITTPLVDNDRAIDSDANPSDGRTAVIVLSAGEEILTIDAGLYTPALTMKKYTNGQDADTESGPEILINTPVTWTYFITNTGTVSLTNISLSDDRVGVVTCPATALLPSASMKCTALGNATLGQYANIGTVSGYVPGTETPIQATDPSHYIGYDTPPVIVVDKSVNQPQLPWPGGPVTFTVVITNTSVNDIVTLTTLTDTVYGNLVGQGTCTMPQTLQLGGVYTCRFPATVLIPEDNGGDLTETNVVTARGTGTNGEPVQDDDDATVFVPCENGGTVSGLVWHDKNDNGIVDQGESPFISDQSLQSGQRIEVPITVEDNDPSRAVADRTTVVVTQNGRFTITGLRLDTAYTFRVADEPLQAMGYLPTFSSLQFGVKAHSCAPTVLSVGYNNGIIGLVGDFHWYDVNRDGKQNEWQDADGDGHIDQSTGQFSLRDMEFVDLNGNGVVDLEGELLKCGINSTGVDASGTSVGPAVNLWTNSEAANRGGIVGSTGYYRFAYDGLNNELSATGSYTVTRDPKDPKTIQSAEDYARRGVCKPVATADNKNIVLATVAGDPAAADDSAQAAENNPVQAVEAPITGPLTCGETTANSGSTNLTDKSSHTDLTLDFAIVCVGTDQLAGLGNRVWLDNNRNGIQDVSEPGVTGMRVNLYVNGDFSAPVRTMLTDAQGNYSFEGLIPTSYVVEFVPSADQAFTKYQEGDDYGISSDADQRTGRTQTVTLAPGQYDPTWDAGILGDPTPDDPTDEPPYTDPKYMYLPMIINN
jgi:fimbrial isopeptide formation D2 family protein/uncharacterized repeat protein (TIGR01451 family)